MSTFNQDRARAYFPIAEERALRNKARVTQRMREMEPQMRKLHEAAQDRKRPPRARMILLRQLGDLIYQAGKGNNACGRGCNHCCHIPVAIAKQEAQIIGQAVGVKPRDVPMRLDMLKPDAKFMGRRCGFLADDGSCSIYEHRPFVCRSHMNLDDVPDLCELSADDTITVPYLNIEQWNFIYCVIGIETGGFALLSDYFPHGLAKR